ncbi:Pre-mRNA-splicing factor 38A [Cichlidogyrus casuarinus]|uniref:Pre-mRNA-splicing factor 38 n=1 Tax=Cichlidogyrus casuarinus TaxID=1844966 RepID=A0ABD2QHL7_9PLAT
MANQTVKDAHTVHGVNPQSLVESIIRSRIYDCKYWKEECFALTAELLVDKAVELKYIGGVYSANVKPAPFLCLVLKMLQIQPDKDIIMEFIRQEDYKYARALGAFYLRLVGDSIEIYKYLETLYNDFRRLKFQDKEGKISLIHMDELIDKLLNENRVCDVILPRLQKRCILEDMDLLPFRQSLLDEDLEDLQLQELDESNNTEKIEENVDEQKSTKRKERKRDNRSRSRSRSRKRKHKDRSRSRSRSRNRIRKHKKSRSRSYERRKHSSRREH